MEKDRKIQIEIENGRRSLIIYHRVIAIMITITTLTTTTTTTYSFRFIASLPSQFANVGFDELDSKRSRVFHKVQEEEVNQYQSQEFGAGILEDANSRVAREGETEGYPQI